MSCWTHARSCLASASVSPKSAMSWRLPGRPSSISSTLRVPPSARVSTSCNTKPIHDPPAGNGPAGHIAPSAHPQSLNTPRAKADPVARRLMTIPGIGPIAATAITALVPAPEGFRAGRDFAAWLGLTPLQKSTGGKHKLGAISKMGERTIRRLLILGASAVVRWASRRGAAAGSWLARMLARKPRMLVTTALANKMARIVWALLVKGGTYRAPAVAA